jgi:hypothetical protein
MVALTQRENPRRWGQQEEETDEGEVSEDVEPMMFARTDRDGRYKIENVKPGAYSVVVWFAQGHKGWNRESSEAAIQRGVRIPGDVPDFKLEKAEPRAPGAGMRGGR